MSAAPSAEYHVEPADYQTDYQDLRSVREPVFVIEQNVPVELEWDALDPLCQHVIARDVQNRPIGTGRLTPQRRIGRMAVVREWRGRGVGAALLVALIDLARARHWPEVELHAQVDAIGFYEKYGFVAHGEEFLDAGIRHRTMTLPLAPIAERPPQVPRPALTPVETLDEAVRACVAVIAGSRREICVFSRDLDFNLLSPAPVLEALRAYATSGVGASVRILLLDPISAQQMGHPWLNLAQRLPSAFEFRVCEDEPDSQYPSAFIAGDRGGLYFRPIGGRIEGEAGDSHPAQAKQLFDLFERMWERARPATEYRAIAI